ncbi:hypothetical protein [Opitutus sp. ER46]|uniref:hypothetical protein n=1 Tax=Opitutus sp. ER46 TaxID=2161864 RepID=UPI0011B1DA0A|nr:hypothetical protein [Opitutus sp. ER46]
MSKNAPNLFDSATMLGKGKTPLKPKRRKSSATPVTSMSDEGDPRPSRFELLARDGHYWSFPYAYVGLIDVPSPAQITIHCNSSDVKAIEVRGRELGKVAIELTQQRLVMLRESEHIEFIRGEPVVTSIEVIYAETDGPGEIL